jgi:hypothetical protein
MCGIALTAGLSYTGGIPWTDFSPAIATVIVGMVPFGLGLMYKDKFLAWKDGKKAQPQANTVTTTPSGRDRIEFSLNREAGSERLRPEPNVIASFFIAGVIALFGWYVVRFILALEPPNTPWTFVLIPYTILAVGVFLLGLGVLSVIIYLRG